MTSLNKSRSTRLKFPHEDGNRTYDVTVSAPYFEFAPKAVGLLEQMRRDKIVVKDVIGFLEDWCTTEASVQQVMLDYRNDHYSIAIVSGLLSRESMVELQISVDPIRSLFSEQSVIVHVLDAKQLSWSQAGKNCLIVAPRESPEKRHAA